MQGLCKPNAESSLFAEVQPILAAVTFFTAAKVRLFPQMAKHFINYLEIVC
jgi:hypothetical protein